VLLTPLMTLMLAREPGAGFMASSIFLSSRSTINPNFSEGRFDQTTATSLFILVLDPGH